MFPRNRLSATVGSARNKRQDSSHPNLEVRTHGICEADTFDLGLANSLGSTLQCEPFELRNFRQGLKETRAHQEFHTALPFWGTVAQKHWCRSHNLFVWISGF